MEQLLASRVIGLTQYPRHFLAVLLLLAVWLGSQFQAGAQQQYNNITGYVCSDSRELSCNTFALYRAQAKYSTIPQIAELFNTTATVVASLSKLSPDQTLETGKAVIIPINCHCGVNSISFANISYTIVDDDTFDKINLNTFEGLSTTAGIEAVNSNINPNLLIVGDQIIFPLRCACPSNAQISNEVKCLVTYPVAEGDVIDTIASSFDVSSEDVINGNTGSNILIDASTTLLIPIKSGQPNYTSEAPPPVAS